MRYSILLNQPRILEWDLNLTQAFLFAFLYELPSWANSITLDNVVYYQAASSKIIQELPLLTDKPDTIKRLKKALSDKDLITSKYIDGKHYIALTEKSRLWNLHAQNTGGDDDSGGGKKIPRGREKNPEQQGKFSHILNNHDQITIDKESSSSSIGMSNACAREGGEATEPSASFSAFSDCEEVEDFQEFEFCEDDYQEDQEEYQDLEFLAGQEKKTSKKISDIAETLLDDFVLDNSDALESPASNDNAKNAQTHAETKKDAETALKTQINENGKIHNETKQSVDMKIAQADQKRQWRTSKAQGAAIVALVDLLESHCTSKDETINSIQAEWMDRNCFKNYYNFTIFMRCIERQLANNTYKIHKSARVEYKLEEKSEAMKSEARENCKQSFQFIQANTAPKPIHSESAKDSFSDLKKKILGAA
jgi:hypothetical protein